MGTIMAAGCLLPLGALAAEVTLVHGDFHVCNVITSRATGEIVAVLDWELATLATRWGHRKPVGVPGSAGRPNR